MEIGKHVYDCWILIRSHDIKRKEACKMLLVWTSLLHSKIKAEFEPLFKAMSSFNPSPGFQGCAFSPHFLLSHLPHTANFILSCCCVVWPLAKRVWRLLLCKWDMSSSAQVKTPVFESWARHLSRLPACSQTKQQMFMVLCE